MLGKIETILSEMDYQYFVEVDYRYDNSNCDCEDICRCATICGERVTVVSIPNIANKIIEVLKKNKIVLKDIDKYCIERLLIVNKAYDPNNFEIGIVNGYYGQEIEKVTLNYKVANKFGKVIRTMLKLKSNRAKIHFVLEKEYGYVLEDLNKVKEYKIETIDKSKIVYGNDYHKKISSCEYYNDEQYDGIRGVVTTMFNKVNDKILEKRYRLIDGHHRVASTEKGKIKVIVGVID